MSVNWTTSATDQLQAIRDYLTRSSPAYAQSIVARIVRRTIILKRMPMLGSEVAEYGDPLIREVHEHPYRIIYQVRGGDVYVIAVIHSARRLPRTPPN